MSIGTFCLRTIVIELQTKQNFNGKEENGKKTMKNDTSPMEVGIY
jgi:hypothetical protein